MNATTHDLSLAGVSIWLDDLSRSRLTSGNLADLIRTHNVVGVTTNPTIFANAIGQGVDYHARIQECAAEGLDAEHTVYELMCEDVSAACDVMREVYDSTGGQDGRVSIEVSPDFAHDTEATVRQAHELWNRVNRPNAMIKIPATEAGIEAISEAIASGISVNVTLIFSLARYRQVINAYLTGLERARQAGYQLSDIHSVASFFVSRLDTLVDSLLENAEDEAASGLRGKSGLANARLAYEVFEQSFTSERARLLIAAGANLQRPLWASTGVKDPSLPDTLYVSGLVAKSVVNTMPEATLFAYADHGPTAVDSITTEYRESDQILNQLDGLGVDYSAVTARLESEAVEKFQLSWSELLTKVENAQAALS